MASDEQKARRISPSQAVTVIRVWAPDLKRQTEALLKVLLRDEKRHPWEAGTNSSVKNGEHSEG